MLFKLSIKLYNWNKIKIDAADYLEKMSPNNSIGTAKTHAKDDINEGSEGRIGQELGSNTSTPKQSLFPNNTQGNSAEQILHLPKVKRDTTEKEKGITGSKSQDRKSMDVRNSKIGCLRLDKTKQPIGKSHRRAKMKPRRIREKKKRENSLSTTFSRLSYCNTPACKYCGHRCCTRRYKYNFKRRAQRRYRRCKRRRIYRKVARSQTRRKSPVTQISGAVGNQVGSRCNMLSPLFIKSNSVPADQVPSDSFYCEITPEMIYQALRRLTMLKQEVKSDAILKFIKANYPVNPESNALSVEMEEKLRVAAIIGIVTRWGIDSWSLPTGLQKRTLTKNHVTLFWQVYTDTIRPITRNENVPQYL